MSDLIGRTLDTYQILEQLGRGGMAVVYKGYQPSLDRYVAVKVLPAHLTHEPDFPARFKREARAVAKLEHPNILAVYDYGHQDTLSYIVMRYVEGGTLSGSMGMPLEMERIVKLIDQISDALGYAHESGVIHRDVKPSNVLLDRGDWPLLTDFGVARMIGATQQLTATGVGMGTPAYMSPEQGLGERVERQSDVYSLGVVLFEMLTGDLPYEAETPLAIVLKHIHDPLPIPSQVNPNIPEAVERVVLKAMAKTTAERFQTTEELAEALRSAVHEAKVTGALDQYSSVAPAAVVAAERSAVAPPIGRLRRFWWLAPAIAVVALAGVLLVQGVLGIPEPSEEAVPEAIETSILQTSPAEAEREAPPEESLEPVAQSDGESAGFYDDFGDPAFEGILDPAKWIYQSDPTCATRQERGELLITNETSQAQVECRLYLPLEELPLLPKIRLLEASIWLSSDHSDVSSEHAWRLDTDLSQGNWYALCGVVGRAEGANAFIEVKNFRSQTFSRSMRISFDAWHTFRLEVDPERLELACYVDGLPIGSVVPDAAPELSEAGTVIRLHAWRPPGSLATAYVDDLRVDIQGSN